MLEDVVQRCSNYINIYNYIYERRSKTHLFLVSNRISKADFECALTAVAKGSRRSCERFAQAMLVTWPRCKNNCSSDFRLLFPGWKSEPFCFFPPQEKANWKSESNLEKAIWLRLQLFPKAHKNKKQAICIKFTNLNQGALA